MSTTSERLDPAVFDRHLDGVIRLEAVRGPTGAIRDFTCTYANAVAVSLLSHPGLVGARLVLALPALEGSTFGAFVQTIASGEPCRRAVALRASVLEVTALRDGDGLLVHLVPARSVSTRNESVDHLQHRVDELTAILDLLPVGVLWGDADCEHLVGNRAAYEMYGMQHGVNASLTHASAAPERERAERLRCFVAGRELEPDELPMQRAARTGEVVRDVEVQVRLADGTAKTLCCNAAPVRGADGRVRAVIGVSADLTERKRLERDREELLARLAGLITHAAVGIAAFDEGLRLVSLNDEAALAFGISKGSALGKTLTELRSAVGLEVEPLLRSVRDGGGALCGVVMAGSGERQWICNYYAIRSADGELLGVGATAIDVTERVRMEGKLRESEERFQQFMSHCPAIAYVKDADGRFVWVNATLERINGRPLRDWIGRTDEDFISPEDAARIRANDRAILDGQTTTSFVETVRGRDGRESWLSYKFPIEDRRAGRTYLAGMSVNISEQVRAAEEVSRLNVELHNRADELQALLDVVPVAIYMAHDPECRRITGNRAASDLLATALRANLSLTAEPAHRPTPHKVFHKGRELEAHELPLQRAARGQEIRGEEYEVLSADGTKKHVFGHASPLWGQDKRARGSVAAFMDITEPVRTRQRLETMFNANLIGTVTWRVDGAITSANDAFLTSVGYSREDLAAGRLSWRALTPPEFAAADAVKLAELARDRRHAPYEKDYLRKDGTRVPVLVSAALFPDSEDEGISYIVDVSEVKRAEQRIRELLGQVTAASRAKDEFLATLAHELRNPLAPIRNAVQVLKAHGSSDPMLTWCRDVIDRQVHHMARLLEDLLDVSRISRDKLELRKERVSIGSIIDVAVETSRPLVEAGHHTLVVEVPPEPLLVDADPVRLAQVFSNLLNNAAKYTPEGGSIVLTVEPRGERVVVTVRDNGIGIARDALPFVFEIFSQARPALDRAQGGLGIGLSLVRGLVQLHGGTVSVRSGVDQGSEFVVELPAAAGKAAREPQGEPAPSASPAHRVLIVDDNADSADTLAVLLRTRQCEVATAYSGERALALATTLEPTIVLLDVGMPGMNGLEVCRRLRHEPWRRDALVIAMTGWGQAEDRRQTRDAGFDQHLVKPIDVATLFKLLGEHPPRPKA